MMPFGKDVLLIEKLEEDDAIVRENPSEARVPTLSWTVAVKEVVAAVVGAPLSKPVDELIVMPAGSAPLVIDQVLGGTPPDAESVVEYDLLTVPLGRVAAVVIASGPLEPAA